MKLSHPTADGIARPARSVPLPARLLVLVLLAAAAFGGFGAQAAFADPATVALSFDQATIPPSGVVTMTATVSSALGQPTGTVTFFDSSAGGASLGMVTLLPNGTNTLTAALSATLGQRAYAIYASYDPSFPDAFGLGIEPAHSATQSIAPPAGPIMHPTQVMVSAPSNTVESGTPITLTATVTNGIGNGVPTGSVTFTDVAHGTIPLGGGASFPLGPDGTAQLVVQDFLLGPHEIMASYSGDSANLSSSSDSPFHLDATAPDVNLRTITSIAVTPRTIAAGDPVTVTATIVQVTATGTIPASGGHVEFTAQEANGYTVHLGSAPLGSGPAPNQAVLQSSSLVVAGTYTISASYFGDIFAPDTPGTARLSVLPLGTSFVIAYTGDDTAVFGHTAHVSATVLDRDGNAVPGRSVTFTIGADSCHATTEVNGNAACTIALTEHPGATAVTVAVAPDAQPGASADYDFAVTPAPTTIAAGFQPGPSTTMLTATLLTEGAPLAGQPVTLTLGGNPCTATTDAAGFASCPVGTVTGQPTATLTATFAGTSDYLGAVDGRSVQLRLTPVPTYTGPASGQYHDPLLLTGTLTDSEGVALGGQPVTFTVGAQSCAATTSSTGVAACLPLGLTQPAGDYTVTMSYAGDGTYAARSVSLPFTIEPEEVALSAIGSNGVINDTTITLGATLLEDNLFPVSGRVVTLTLGPSSCQGVTNVLGVVTCTVPRAAALGPATAAGTFAGDAYYLGATFSRTVFLCSFASGGSFVIGDRDDAGPVTFWGSQWSKRNHLSQGDAPPSFKGWAQGAFTASWNGGWSTDPGSSSPPPSGRLPAYMAVIQSGSTAKSGSRITGDTMGIVVVKTDPGYAPDAGHDGTGTIVATVR